MLQRWLITLSIGNLKALRQGSAYEACDRTRTPPHTPKMSKACDISHAIICNKGNEACDIPHASK